jgi:hypothetical protein
LDRILEKLTKPVTNEQFLKLLGGEWVESIPGGEAREIVVHWEHRVEIRKDEDI